MSKINDGGPVYPTLWDATDRPGWRTEGGLCLRDYFASQIAGGMSAFSGTAGVSYGPAEIAGRSYEVADAMIAARAKGGGDE